VKPEAQWSGVEINLPSLHHRGSASLGCLRGETGRLTSLARQGKLLAVKSCIALFPQAISDKMLNINVATHSRHLK